MHLKPRMKKPDINLILRLLITSYGDRTWEKRLEPVGELILTILSQNTSDVNSHRAFKSLVDDFNTWEKIAGWDTSRIVGAIRAGGLAQVKARYIKHVLQALQKETRNFDLGFLADMSLDKARRWLMRLPGVGMKTSSCVLLFSLHMPAFPVDTHVHRVTIRLGIIHNKTSVEDAHIQMEKLVKPQDIYRCHVLMIEHGRKTCKAQHPLCKACALKQICPSYIIFTRPA